MTKLPIVLLLAALVLVSGFESIHSEMELIDGGGTEASSGDCGIILTTLQMSQKRLDLLEGAVQTITPNLRESIELKFYKLLEKIEHIIETKFDALDKKMDTNFQETKTYMQSKLTVIEDKLSEYISHVDSKINGLESTVHALNVSDTLNSNDACCRVSLETTAFVKNTTTKINDMNYRTINVSVKLQEMNEAIRNLTDIVVPSFLNKNISEQNAPIKSTEPAHNVPDTITTTEINKLAPTKCESSQQEECCTDAVVASNYEVYTEISARWHHTVVNMTSAGLQEYTMYFAVRGEWVTLILSSTSSMSDLFYIIGLTDLSGGYIYLHEQLSSNVYWRAVHNIYSTNVISAEKYTYYYVRISGDTLEVGRRGEPPLRNHTSIELRRLKYFSFSRASSKTGEALYDCPAE